MTGLFELRLRVLTGLWPIWFQRKTLLLIRSNTQKYTCKYSRAGKRLTNTFKAFSTGFTSGTFLKQDANLLLLRTCNELKTSSASQAKKKEHLDRQRPICFCPTRKTCAAKREGTKLQPDGFPFEQIPEALRREWVKP